MQILLVAVGVLILAEGSARLLTPRFGQTTTWYTPAAAERFEVLTSQNWNLDPPHTVFVGSSQVGRGIDDSLYTDITGASASNMALPGGGPELVEQWLRDEILPRADIRHVILGLSSFEFNLANRDTNAGNRYKQQLATRTDFQASIARLAQTRLALYRHREVLSNAWMLQQELRQPTAQPDFSVPILELPYPDEDGYFDISLSRVRRNVLNEFEVDMTAFAALERLLDSLRAQGIRVTVVYMPVTAEYVAAHPSGRSDFELIRELARETTIARESEFVDLSRSLPLSAFFDHIHLNPEGADAFTRLFAKAIAPS